MFTLAKLPYAYNSLEPYIDEQTMITHHDKHHQGYVDNLNKAIAGYQDLQDKTVEQLLSDLDKLRLRLGLWSKTMAAAMPTIVCFGAF